MYSLYSGGYPVSGDLAARLSNSNGDVQINTDITAVGNEVQQVFEFSLRATPRTAAVFADKAVRVTVGCFSETTISGALVASPPANFSSFSDDGAVFKIYLLGFRQGDAADTFSVHLNSVFQWTTDIPDCFESQLTLVDNAGAPTTDSVIFLDSNPTLKDEVTGLVDAMLNINRTNPIYTDIFVKGQTSNSAVYSTLKGKVTVCGDEEITNIDPTNSLFSIEESGNPDAEEVLQFSLAGIYQTGSAILPTNECPVSNYRVCADSLCASEYDTGSIRISADASFLEVNANVPIAPTTIYLESITVSGNSLIEPVSIFVCGFETFSLTDAAPYTDTIEVFSGEH